MKSAQELINETIKKLQFKRKSENLSPSDSNDCTLSPFDLMYLFIQTPRPIHLTGIIEDYLFRESRQIFDILKEDTDQDIEGLTYAEIKNDSVKNAYYDKVRHNIPKYYALKLSERQKHFEMQGQLYLKKLGINSDEIQNNIGPENPIKKQTKIHQPTPIKCAISKKQALRTKKQQKKNSKKSTHKTETHENVSSLNEEKQNQEQKFHTPQKKQKQKKKVKFFEFQYVKGKILVNKDFSQYKTPKNLAVAEQLIEPLKQIEPQHQKQ